MRIFSKFYRSIRGKSIKKLNFSKVSKLPELIFPEFDDLELEFTKDLFINSKLHLGVAMKGEKILYSNQLGSLQIYGEKCIFTFATSISDYAIRYLKLSTYHKFMFQLNAKDNLIILYIYAENTTISLIGRPGLPVLYSDINNFRKAK